MTSQSRENLLSAILVYSAASLAMVLCVVIGCTKRSGRDKDVSFYRIPKVVTHRGKQEHELTKKRRAGFLAAISRDCFQGSSVLENDRICSRHFISGKPAYLFDETNPDWLPTLHLGHTKKRSSREISKRWARKKAATPPLHLSCVDGMKPSVVRLVDMKLLPHTSC